MQTVLLADDTDAIRNLCSRVLREHGYAVLEVSDGQDALSLARRHREPMDLLITDLVMPRLGGLGLSRAFRTAHPEAGVLFISGYHTEELATDASFLRKPFTPYELLRRVGELLSNRNRACSDLAAPVDSESASPAQ